MCCTKLCSSIIDSPLLFFVFFQLNRLYSNYTSVS